MAGKCVLACIHSHACAAAAAPVPAAAVYATREVAALTAAASAYETLNEVQMT